MKNRYYIIIILAVCFSSDALSNTHKLPTRQQATKLAAAAWKEPVQSIDITYYVAIKELDKSESQIRKQVEDSFEDIYGPKAELSPATLELRNHSVEMNVARILKEQQIGRKMKVRIRIVDNHQRVDMVFGKPEVIIFAGTDKEERMPGKQLDANTPFSMTDFEVIDKEGVYTHFEYFHENKAATIRTKPAKTFKKSNILKLMGMPDESSFMLQRLLGRKENTSSGEVYIPDEPKINRLCSGTLDDISVRIFPDEDTPETKERIEISLPNEKSTIPMTVMVCDKQDYSKVYYYELKNPMTNLPIITKVCNNFDPNSFPQRSTEIKYDDRGNITREITHRIESVRLNIPIPDNVFEFHPPKDYIVNDLRLTPAERLNQDIERMKEWLTHEKWTDRFRALGALEDYLRDNPAELMDIAASMLDDKQPAIRKKAAMILQRIESDK